MLSPRGSELSTTSTGGIPVQKTRPTGILRLDISAGRQRQGSVEFRKCAQVEPASPQPSVDRLSVTFAPPPEDRSAGSDSSVKFPQFTGPSTLTPPFSAPAEMERVRFPSAPTDGDGSEDEDYSASVTAVIQRRASTRRSRRRRASSPFSPDSDPYNRRRSSVFTTSSGDTAISIEPTATKEINERLRLHQEVLSGVRNTPWDMRRKLRLVRTAHAYIRQHEGALKERLAASKNTRDVLKRFMLLATTKWQYMKREIANLANYLTPWERRIKHIESHFGSVVASYFTFLRWLFWVNLVISIVLVSFVAIPEMVMAQVNSTDTRKVMLPDEQVKSTNLVTLWNFEGILKYSPLFYGYYTNKNDKRQSYRLPLAYFLTGLAVYVYSFVAILRKMAENSRMSKLSEKGDECIFTWKLFTGWDFMIGNSETAHNRVASIVLGFKEALLEEAEKQREARNWKIIGIRVFVNLVVIGLLGMSAYAVILVVQRSTEDAKGWWRQNEITVVLSLISIIFPILFEVLGFLEKFHPRRQLRIQLARIMVLNLLNLYSLIIALFDKIEDMSTELSGLYDELTSNKTIKRNSYEPTTKYPIAKSTSPILFSNIPETTETVVGNILEETCINISIDCSTTTASSFSETLVSMLLSTSLLSNITTNVTDMIDSNSFMFSTSDNMTTEIIPTSYDESLINNLQSTSFNDLTTSDDTYTTSTIIDNSIKSKDFSSIEMPFRDDSFVDEIDSDNINFESFTSKERLRRRDIDFEEYDYPDYFELDYSYENTVTPEISADLLKKITTTISNAVKINLNITEMDENFTAFLTSTLTPYISDETSADYITTTIINKINEMDFSTIPLFTDEHICYAMKCGNISVDSTMSVDVTVDQFSQEATKPSDYTTNYMSTIDLEDLESKKKEELLQVVAKLDILKKIRGLCWETMFGQELVKLTIMDLILTILSTLMIDFFRALFVRVMNNCWCWDLEKKFPQYGDFKIAENILHLVNNQGLVWMGLFFSPGLALINLFKLAIMMYLRSWAVLTCNVPHEVVFRASRSNNFYLALLLTMLFLCVLPVGYAMVWVTPSWHCGPFSSYKRISTWFTRTLFEALPKPIHKAVEYMASPGIVIPLLVLLILIIYYLMSLTSALREANNDLKIQLRRERTEERRKMFQLADRRRKLGSSEADNTPFARWKKILPPVTTFKPSGKDDTASFKAQGNRSTEVDTVNEANRKTEIINKLMKKALRTSSATSEDDSGNQNIPAEDCGTDTEQYNSLPEDKKETNESMQNMDKLKEPPQISKDFKIKKVQENTVMPGKSALKKIRSESNKREDSLKKKSLDLSTKEHRDSIPIIKISKTESSECVLEKIQNDKKNNEIRIIENKLSKIKRHFYDSRTSDTQNTNQCSSSLDFKDVEGSSSETIVAIDDDETVEEQSKQNGSAATLDIEFKDSNEEQISDKTKTESSADYKEF